MPATWCGPPAAANYLIWSGHAYEIPDQWLAAVGYKSTDALPVGDDFVATLPAGQLIAPPTLAGIGQPGPALPGSVDPVVIGSIFADRVNAYYLMTQDGLAALTPLQAGLLLADKRLTAAYGGGNPSPLPISQAQVTDATLVPLPDLGLGEQAPSAAPELSTLPPGQQQLCIRYSDQQVPEIVVGAGRSGCDHCRRPRPTAHRERCPGRGPAQSGYPRHHCLPGHRHRDPLSRRRSAHPGTARPGRRQRRAVAGRAGRAATAGAAAGSCGRGPAGVLRRLPPTTSPDHKDRCPAELGNARQHTAGWIGGPAQPRSGVGRRVDRTRAGHLDYVAQLRRILATPAVRSRWGDEAASDQWPFDDPSAIRFAIVLAGAVVGMVQYGEEDDPSYRHASIDIFVEPAVHGRGIGRDAVRTLARHLIVDRGHHRLVIDPAADNVAAIHCYAAVGFRPVGVLRSYERVLRGSVRSSMGRENELFSAAGPHSWMAGRHSAVCAAERHFRGVFQSTPRRLWCR